MAIGEAGTLVADTPSSGTSVTGQGTPLYEVEVTFTEPLDDPVIVLNSSNNGGNKFALRVTEEIVDPNTGLTTAFKFTFDEYENEDGPHPADETVTWLAIEEGVHTLPDGRVIVAGEATADEAGVNVDFDDGIGTSPFDGAADPPVVLTTVTGPSVTPTNGNVNNNYGPESGPVADSNPEDITTDGFTLEVNRSEDEANNAAFDGFEKTVGYIAIETGDQNGTDNVPFAGVFGNLDEDAGGDQNVYTVDGEYTNPIVLAETQDEIDDDSNGNDTNGNTGVDTGTVLLDGVVNDTVNDEVEIDLEFEEETSLDNEGDTDNKDVGIVIFESGLIFCFTEGTLIETPWGSKAVEDLEKNDLIITKDNGIQPLRWVGSKRINARELDENPNLRPVEVPAHAFGQGVPNRPISLSQQHRITVESPEAELLFGHREVFVQAKALASAQMKDPNQGVTYYHLMFDDHQIVYANGLEAESLHPGHLASRSLDKPALEELFAIFPELRALPESYGPACRHILKNYEAELLAAPRLIH